MSARRKRKSTPVRRLDMICSKLQYEQGNPGEAPEWLAHGIPNGEGDVIHSEEPTGAQESPPMDESELPETEDRQGVYVLQPEGVDDDDDNDNEPRDMKLDTVAKVTHQGRKRSHDDEELQHFTPGRHDYESWSGLDLSVKRPRTDVSHDSHIGSEKTGALRSKSTSPNMFSGTGEGSSADIKDQLEKYHHLMRLVDQQKPLAHAMEEVGLTIQEFFALHRLNNQLSSSRQDKPQTPFIENPKILSAPAMISTVFEKFSPKEQTSSVPMADEWMTSKENHDAKIQALLKEANEDVIQQQKKSSEAQQLSSSRLQQQPTTLNPSMTVALMASLAANPDQNTEERQGILRNLFMKTQGFLSQGSNPNKSLDSYMPANNSPGLMDRSASKNESITAGTVSSGVGSIKKGTLDPSNFDEDVFDQYIAKFTNINRCASMTCPYFTRDHYHCVVEDCNYQRFTNKADVIRHYNMHKKRDNSLAHGFLRFSPTEDCSAKYSNCHLNGKSTHYHCMQPDCNKVYTSTSDVMTHENFHKKYMQFVCSGFKRFRATEQCDLVSCVFRNQKTTHFHCTRADCNFTFKNKCDIEKHKTYHLRDDSYLSKGFKKFYKNEACSNSECVWNYTANHFHCMRPGCNFSFTSTSQMESHKRKHDRNEFLAENPDSDSKPGTSQKPAFSSRELSTPPRKPSNPNVSHYKLPPRTLKFTQFVPPVTSTSTPLKFTHFVPPATSASLRKETIRGPPNVNPLAPPYCNARPHLPHLLLSPKRASMALNGRVGPLMIPGNLSMSSLPHTADRPYLSHSLLSPFSPYMAAVASRCITNNLQGNTSQNSPKMPMFNPALFQEAARKILASMPTGSMTPGLPGLSAPQQPSMGEVPQEVFSRPQSGSVSPSTPVATNRSFSMGGFYPSQSDGTSLSIKEEPSWKTPSSYAEVLQSHNGPFSSAGIASNGESHLMMPKSSKSTLEVSRSDWPRAGGVISPSMALNAAAALKSGTSHLETSGADGNDGNSENVKPNDANMEEDVKRVERKTMEKNDNAVALTGSPQRHRVMKYFAGAAAFGCWIKNCDFFAKQHFHCLVENCEAMFTTSENVLKHAKFHENLESMGAALPIQSTLAITSSSPQDVDKPKAEEHVSEPPPGYIALQSGTIKSRQSATDFDAASPGTSGAISMPSSTKKSVIISNPAVRQENTLIPFSLGNLPFTQSQASMPTLASQLYAAALLKGVGTPSRSEIPVTQPLTSTPISTYKLLQNQASLSALMGHVAQAAASQSAADPSSASSAAIPGDLEQPVYLDKKPEGGYIHCKTGMPCLRRDCKYIHQNHWHCTMNRCRYVCKSLGKAQTHRQAHDSLEVYARSAKQCFRSYSVKKKCPNSNCEFRLRGHYHCLKPGCQFSTIGTSKLPWHMKKHEKIARREASGFKYFTKKEQCGHFDCKYNGLFSHYHCIRTGCTFAFQYKHQMSTHVRKHLRRMLGRSYTGDMQDIDHTNVDSGDDSLPLIIDEMDEAEQGPGVRLPEEQLIAQDEGRLTKQQLDVLERMTKQMKSSYAAFTPSQGNVNEQELVSDIMGQRAPEALENEDNVSDGHSVGYQEALDLTSMAPGSSKLNEMGAHGQSRDMDSPQEDSNSNGFGNTTDEADANMDAENDDSSRASRSPPAKSPGRGPYVTKFKLGEDVMEGFQRFEANENCSDDRCTYMFKVSHYHCTRENCFYRFTGRTHMFKHQQHHDRVAGLVRDDFKRFKASNPCEEDHCEFRGKNTHFHCLRCDFKCTDSAKVGTHRRQHIKADTLEQSGFQRVRGKDDCGREDCKYRSRNMSHFHCLQPGCSYAIVGLTGIELHAEKHKRGLLQTPAATQSANTDLILQNLGVFQSMRQQLLNASMPGRMLQNGMDDSGAGHNLSLPNLSSIREMQSQLSEKPHQPISPTSSGENGNSNHGLPFAMANSSDTSLVLSKYPLLGGSSPAAGVIATAAPSPVSSTAVSMVAEGVGS